VPVFRNYSERHLPNATTDLERLLDIMEPGHFGPQKGGCEMSGQWTLDIFRIVIELPAIFNV